MKLKKLTAIVLTFALLIGATACYGGETTTTTATASGENGGDDANSDTNAQGKSGGEKTPSDIGIINDVENVPAVGSNDDYSYADDVPDSEYVLGGPLTERMIALSELNTGNQVRLARAMKKAAAGGGDQRGLYRRFYHRGLQRG